ncbi:hypothetical protein LTR94_029213 [Friedmanniomyces endolithicus]|nr:hypothetical protein LTR94_029213 [Friedmanniomyces endolithicus]
MAVADPVGPGIGEIAMDQDDRPPFPHLAPGDRGAIEAVEEAGFGGGVGQGFGLREACYTNGIPWPSTSLGLNGGWALWLDAVGVRS